MIRNSGIKLGHSQISVPKINIPMSKAACIKPWQVTGGNTPNLVSKKMLRYFLKIPLLKKIRIQNLYKKENFKPEIKPMIENLQDELYQLENKQAEKC